MNDASVVCRQLQCGVTEKAYNPPKSERGTGPVGLRSVQCAGNETNLTLCITSTSQAEQAGIAEDVGVICSDFTDLRLVSGSDCAGRLEVFYSGTWGSVCNSPMDAVTMALICKHLDCGDRGTLLNEFTHGRGSGPTWVDGVRCDKQHTSLWQCPSDPWKQQSCNRVQETHIACEGKLPQTLFTECPNSTSCTDQEKLRIVGEEDRCSGRVEVWYRGSWGTVCDDSWDMVDANVVCKQLGCGFAVSAPGEAAFGEGTGPIWVETLNCRGTESSLWDCPAKPWGESNCDHKEDAAVNCSGITEEAKLRLVDGGSPCAGRVEIKHQDQWGTVCDDNWDMTDAGVVCKQLGCGAADKAPGNAHFGRGSGQIWLNNVACDGTESALWHCGNKGWGKNDCGHEKDAGVTCSGVNELRLADGGSPCAGRVEVKHQDQWGTVCDDGWDMADAGIVCKQLGCGAAVSVHLNAYFGRGSGPIWLKNVACDGTKSALWHCRNEGWGKNDCIHREDAGVTCSGAEELRLVNGGSPCAGRVEVKHQDRCDREDRFSEYPS
ncbi:deleted in malignant brain tumors 1 protein-like [Chrysemys picta bellii]|uniref:deleted in malignant brain tumors 1 protein-like n=1 Tax=Chrysemys picta bellii TaxID=8478 RepID=UPI0032B131C6